MTDDERDSAASFDPPAGGVRDLTPPAGIARADEPGELDAVLGTFKSDPPDADSNGVNDALGARPRMSWNPVTDSGGDAPPRPAEAEPDTGGFAFNLGSALAKLGIDAEGHPTAPSRDPLENLRASFGVGTEHDAPRAAAPVAPPVAPPMAPAADNPVLERRHRSAAPPPVEPRLDATVETPAPPARTQIDPPTLDVRVRQTAPEPAGPGFDELLPRRTSTTPAPQASAPTAPPAPPTPPPAPAIPDAVAAPARPAPTAPDELETAPRPYVGQRRSVFDDVVSPSPTLPPTVVAPSPPRSVAPVTSQPIMPPVAHVAGEPALPAAAVAPVLPVGTDPNVAAPVMGMPILPTLPAAPAAPPVPMATTTNHDLYDTHQATQADLRALRSAQLRAGRSQKKGRVFGRTLLVLLVLGGLVGAGFVFGRDYLFPVEWDPALTPVVDEIQAERGADFVHTVGLVVQPADEFALTVTQLTIGDGWVSRVPEWRALGLVAGDPTVAGIAADVAGDRLAVYDPATDRVYMPQSADPTVAHADLRVALEQAFEAQQGETAPTPPPASSLAGVSSPEVVAQRAVDTYIARRDAGHADDAPSTRRDANLPLPIEYELLAAETFGEATLTAAGADPATATFATDVSEVLASVLDDAPKAAEPAPVQLGERALAEPVALGVDDWSLVWGTRLPVETVDQLVAMTVADSYHPIDRSGTTCVAGVFETANPDQANVMLAAMTQWVGASPSGAAASATLLSATRVQLVACDPGPDAAVASASNAVSALVDRQLVRLAG